MRGDDLFVGSLAMAIALVATASAVGVFEAPYQLRSVRAIQNRYGDLAARVLFLLLATLMLTSGAAILSGFRPSFDDMERAASNRTR